MYHTMSHYGINIEFQHPDPEAPLLKSPPRLVTWGPHQAQSAWRKQSVQPGLNDSTRKAFRPTMLTCKFPMLQRDTVGRPFAKKNQPRDQFPNCSGKWALVDLPMLDPFQTTKFVPDSPDPKRGFPSFSHQNCQKIMAPPVRHQEWAIRAPRHRNTKSLSRGHIPCRATVNRLLRI